jgi:hypothetical protein
VVGHMITIRGRGRPFSLEKKVQGQSRLGKPPRDRIQAYLWAASCLKHAPTCCSPPVSSRSQVWSVLSHMAGSPCRRQEGEERGVPKLPTVYKSGVVGGRQMTSGIVVTQGVKDKLCWIQVVLGSWSHAPPARLRLRALAASSCALRAASSWDR